MTMRAIWATARKDLTPGMRAVVQRVKSAAVEVGGEEISRIGKGLLVLLGVTHPDTIETARGLADKVLKLRIFEDEEGKMNRSVADVEGGVLAVSQFTLYADCRRGNRPGFSDAAPPEKAEELYEEFALALRQVLPTVKKGVFGAKMLVKLENDGPVTIILEK